MASASPRRRQLLTTAGYSFEIRPADIDERPLPAEPAKIYVERLARTKAETVAATLATTEPGQIEVVTVGADTIVTIDDALLGKPNDSADAARMLRQLSARRHQVMTGVALIGGGRTVSAVEVTDVWFRELSDSEIQRYVATGEPFDKAGSYAIQGLGSALVEHTDGSWDNIVGLPVQLFEALLASHTR